MATTPTEVTLTVSPAARFDAVDVRARLNAEHTDLLGRYRRALYCSLHTTAGYIDHTLASRLHNRSDHVAQFFGAFRALFPPDAAYRHDQMHLREELSETQRQVEPRNGDSHLTFIGSGMRNCVTQRNDREGPVYFIDLDGVHGAGRRLRTTTVMAYDRERIVHRVTLPIAVSRHTVDSINLADPRCGFLEEIADLVDRFGIAKGRIDVALPPSERNAGLTVNEYETLLMKHDLPEVLHDPLKFAVQKSRHMLENPGAIPGKTIDYAKYDLVHVFNSLMEAFRIQESGVERLLAKLIAVPARRFLAMKRSISFPVTDLRRDDGSRLVRGTYQSPILVQWRRAEAQVREVEVSLVRFD